MKKRIEGQVCRFGHNCDISRLLSSGKTGLGDHSKPSLFAESAAESKLPIQKTAIILAGRKFGGGSPASEAIASLKSSGVDCVIASSFTRQFYRGAINQGIPLIECPDAFERISAGEIITVDFEKCEIVHKKGIIKFPAYPDIISRILASGGLIAHARRSLGQ